MILDKFQTPIDLGDKVAAAVRRGDSAELRVGEVVGFTKTCGVRVKHRRFSWETEDTTSTIWPREMMVIEKAPQP